MDVTPKTAGMRTGDNTAESPSNALAKNLADLAIRGALPHTVVIEGGDIAVRRDIISKVCAALVCTDDGKRTAGRACGKCASCEMLGKAAYGKGEDLAFAHPDITVLEYIPKGDKAVSVDDVRSVKSDAFTSPVSADCKIYIALSAEKLNVQSQNALLKLLEEPPKNVYFIFSCPSAKMLLQTVRSRGAVFSAGSLSEDDAEKYIRRLFPKESDDFVSRTAGLYRCCDGLVIEGVSPQSLAAAYAAADTFFSGGEPELLLSTRKNVDAKELQLAFDVMSVAARDVMLARTPGISSAKPTVLPDTVLKRTPYNAITAAKFCALFSEGAQRLAESANPNAVLALVTANVM